VLLASSAGNITGYLHGIGSGPRIAFLPALKEQWNGGGYPSPFGVAVDAAHNIFVALSGTWEISEGYVKEFEAGGAVKNWKTGFKQPLGIAVDGGGNIFVADTYNHAVKEIPAGCDSADCIVPIGGTFGLPNAVAVDGSGNVFVTDQDSTSAKELLAASGYKTVLSLGSGLSIPNGIAVDGSGNIFVSDKSAIKEIPAAGGYTTVRTLFQGALPGRQYEPNSGIAVDGSGNVFFSYTRSKAVQEMLASNDYTTVQTLFNVDHPIGVAADGDGNVLVVDSDNIAAFSVEILDYAHEPSLTFKTGTTVGAVDTADGPLTVTVGNTGNMPLTFSPSRPPTCSMPNCRLWPQRIASSCPNCNWKSSNPARFPSSLRPRGQVS
jgi:sugar lactone lactonase YvrE